MAKHNPHEPRAHDFATSPIEPAPPLPRPAPPHVHYDLNIDTSVANNISMTSPNLNTGITRSDTELSRTGNVSPTMLRRRARAATFRTVEDFDDFEVRPGWHPGAEPGLDPAKPDGGHASMPTLHVPSKITVVDFSPDHLDVKVLNNDTLALFLEIPPPHWSKCRWINVNGLSWDVISVLGKYKNLHKLAIEDLMNTRNRTKADWYAHHAFIILTLQKLVHLEELDSSDEADVPDDGASVGSGGTSRSKRKITKRLRKMLRLGRRTRLTPDSKLENGSTRRGSAEKDVSDQSDALSEGLELNNVRTLQRYHAPPNDVRTEFMEAHSVLSDRQLAVTAEQVSMFITSDNTLISFFELSALDVQNPILTRLSSPDTILRQSCDASMIAQAIIDAIIDLAIPVTSCYTDVVADLELDVLTRPDVNHTKKLYITITEINKMLAFISPIANLINALRDHKAEQEAATKDMQNPATGVIISPLTYIYLGDVLDHCVLINESLQQIKEQADGMISLIFNTISAYQNETIKQLTFVTMMFLPMTFVTGYFGMNFEPFHDLQEGIPFFWKVAGPTIFFTFVILMRETIYDYVTSMFEKRRIVSLRKMRRQERKKRQ